MRAIISRARSFASWARFFASSLERDKAGRGSGALSFGGRDELVEPPQVHLRLVTLYALARVLPSPHQLATALYQPRLLPRVLLFAVLRHARLAVTLHTALSVGCRVAVVGGDARDSSFSTILQRLQDALLPIAAASLTPSYGRASVPRRALTPSVGLISSPRSARPTSHMPVKSSRNAGRDHPHRLRVRLKE